jgi:hypothetical protein
MKCPYCGVNELGTGDINGKCYACENKFNNSGYPLLGDVTAAEVDIIVDALYDYQLHIMGIKELEETNFVVKIILDKLTKDLPEID